MHPSASSARSPCCCLLCVCVCGSSYPQLLRPGVSLLLRIEPRPTIGVCVWLAAYVCVCACFVCRTCNFDCLYSYLTCGNYDFRCKRFSFEPRHAFCSRTAFSHSSFLCLCRRHAEGVRILDVVLTRSTRPDLNLTDVFSVRSLRPRRAIRTAMAHEIMMCKSNHAIPTLFTRIVNVVLTFFALFVRRRHCPGTLKSSNSPPPPASLMWSSRAILGENIRSRL